MLRHLAVITIPIFILAAAAATAADTPEDIVARQLAAMRAGDWDQFTSCMHDRTLREFQAGVIDILKSAPESGNRDQILRAYFGSKSVGDLTAVSPATFFGLFMNG